MTNTKKEQSPLSKLSLALSGIDTCLAMMDGGEHDKRLIVKAKAHIEVATEALITIQTTLEKL